MRVGIAHFKMVAGEPQRRDRLTRRRARSLRQQNSHSRPSGTIFPARALLIATVVRRSPSANSSRCGHDALTLARHALEHGCRRNSRWPRRRHAGAPGRQRHRPHRRHRLVGGLYAVSAAFLGAIERRVGGSQHGRYLGARLAARDPDAHGGVDRHRRQPLPRPPGRPRARVRRPSRHRRPYPAGSRRIPPRQAGRRCRTPACWLPMVAANSRKVSSPMPWPKRSLTVLK